MSHAVLCFLALLCLDSTAKSQIVGTHYPSLLCKVVVGFDFTALGSDGELCCFSYNGYKVTHVEKRQYSTWKVVKELFSHTSVGKISVSTFSFLSLISFEISN